MSTTPPVAALLAEVRSCVHCARHLPLGPRPVVQADPGARILIAGQAPGRKVHASGIPFDDASGQRLRHWMGIDEATFYDASRIAILPMGFCYPGTGPSGDLPPRPECAPLWRARLLESMPDIELTLVLGRHALDWHLPDGARSALTDSVKAWRERDRRVIALPHPSPRNNIWLKRNPWFADDLVPWLQSRVAAILGRR